MDKPLKKKTSVSNGNGYMWPNENDSTTLPVKKNPCQIERMCVEEASLFLGVDECIIIK